MLPNKRNHKQFVKAQQQLLAFLNEQTNSLPKNWNMDDHIMVVLTTLITTMYNTGWSKAEIRANIENVLALKQDLH